MKKIAVITGASSGMGYQFALQIDKNYKTIDEVWLIARRRERLEELSREMDKPCVIISEDINDKTFPDTLLKMLKKETVKIKMLVNCAGYGMIGAVGTVDMEMETGMIDTNCKALTMMCILAMPYMADNSRIINLASSAAFMPQPYFTTYAATKSYVLSFSRAFNREVKAKGIVVTAVCPGPVDTEFFTIAESKTKRAWFKKFFMASPEAVVAKALKDSVSKKELSVYGSSMKGLLIFTKLVPHKIMLDFYGKMKRHVENEENNEKHNEEHNKENNG